MNKAQLILKVAEETGFTKKDVAAMVEATLGTIKGTLLEAGKVHLHGFGTFNRRTLAARKIYDHFGTGGEKKMESRETVRFKPAVEFKGELATVPAAG
ncbi:MAG: HU family DNA-binding protein [Syntrophobacterales bacterium]|jgi:DNA-binding protein HU-beta|nr:HU family DNA-binding protein [Syntrophobacterales bacterium]